MAVRVIKAKTVEKPQEERRKQRVACYCRVSTSGDDQESSFEIQQSHFTRLINNNPDWEMAGIYADQGITGTSIKHREQFNKLIKDCEDKKIDLVLTKSISRFARNTVDCLNAIRKLKSLGVPIVFSKENINTISAAGEVLITIMASLAQAESESISKNVKLGVSYRFREGQRIDSPKQMLGYDIDADGNETIDPEQATVVRRIYREFLDGIPIGLIARRLKADGIKSNRGKCSWTANSVVYILRNEKYAGHVLLQKYYKKDVLAHRSTKNEGEVQQYFVENCHKALIPPLVFNLVQEKLDTERFARANRPLAGIIRCPKCGGLYRKESRSGRWHCENR